MEDQRDNAVAMPQAQHDAQAGRVERCLLWLGATALASGAIAWVAVSLQSVGFAPLLLMPLAVGIGLGVAMEGLAWLLSVRPTRSWWLVAAGGGLLLIGAQACFGYIIYRHSFAEQEQKHPQLNLFRGGEQTAEAGGESLGPATFAHYMKSRLTRSPGWLLWTADGLATLAGVLGWTIWRFRARQQAAAGRSDGGGSNAPSNPALPG